MFNRVGVSTGAQVEILPVPGAEPGRKPIRQLGPLVRLRLVNHGCHGPGSLWQGRTPSSKRSSTPRYCRVALFYIRYITGAGPEAG
jgi:hypothetical protein